MLRKTHRMRAAAVASANLALFLSALASPSFASFEVIEVTTLDTANNHVQVWDGIGSDTYEPQGIDNYVTEFKYKDDGGTTRTVSTERFAAFKKTLSGIDQVIQPTSTGSQPVFSTAEEYLTSGTRGLSTSTGINMVASTTAPQDLFIDVSSAIYGSASDDILLLADAADNQSLDEIRLLDVNNDVLGFFTLKPYNDSDPDWWVLGEQTINRIKFDGSGYPNNGQGDTRDLAFAALSWSDFGIDSQAALDDIARLEFKIPGSGSQPRTDYAFIAANTDFIQSPDLVPPADVPAPATLAMLLPGLSWLGWGMSSARRIRLN